MRVVLEDSVFEDRWLSDLMVIMWLGVQGRHRVEVRDPGGSRYVRWERGLGEMTRNEWGAMLDLSASVEAHEPAYFAVALEDRVDVAWSQSPPRLPVAASVRYLMRPYRILLENNRNDRAFFRCVVPKRIREELDRRERLGGLEYEHGGGADQLPRVEELDAQRGDALLYSVMFDSDGLRPSTRSNAATKLAQACEGRGIHHHVLARRMIENFVPSESLKRWAVRDRAAAPLVDVFQGMNLDQRAHYNLEGGFDGDLSRHDRETVGDLYATLPTATRDKLARGFGKRIKSIYTSNKVAPEDFDGAAAERGIPEVRRFAEEVLERSR